MLESGNDVFTWREPFRTDFNEVFYLFWFNYDCPYVLSSFIEVVVGEVVNTWLKELKRHQALLTTNKITCVDK